jgi:hypothetical protein
MELDVMQKQEFPMKSVSKRTGSSQQPVNGPRPSESSRQPAEDAVDEAAKESFPASDPPAFTGTTGSPSNGPTARPPKPK